MCINVTSNTISHAQVLVLSCILSRRNSTPGSESVPFRLWNKHQAWRKITGPLTSRRGPLLYRKNAVYPFSATFKNGTRCPSDSLSTAETTADTSQRLSLLLHVDKILLFFISVEKQSSSLVGIARRTRGIYGSERKWRKSSS